MEQKFITYITKLNPFHLCGIATILGVDIFEDEKQEKPRDGAAVLSDMIQKFAALNRQQKRTLLKVIKDAAKN